MHPRLRNLLLATTPLLVFGLTQATAGPEGGTVVGGAATIQGQGGPAVIVNQSTSSAVINWNTFNVKPRPARLHRQCRCRRAAGRSGQAAT